MPSSLRAEESSRSLIPPTPESDFGCFTLSPPSDNTSISSVGMTCQSLNKDEAKPNVPQKRKAGRKPLYKTAQERRDRNRRAQLAFRARRSDYLAKLEDTCRSYELVVAELQESNREANDALARERHRVRYLERILQDATAFSRQRGHPTASFQSTLGIPVSTTSGNDGMSAPTTQMQHQQQRGVSVPFSEQVFPLIISEQQVSPCASSSSMAQFLFPENYLGMHPVPMLDLGS